jgi:hypothetical protein
MPDPIAIIGFVGIALVVLARSYRRKNITHKQTKPDRP